MNTDLQAIMARRRRLADSTKQSSNDGGGDGSADELDLELSMSDLKLDQDHTTGFHGSGGHHSSKEMNVDLQSIMERRRRIADGEVVEEDEPEPPPPETQKNDLQEIMERRRRIADGEPDPVLVEQQRREEEELAENQMKKGSLHHIMERRRRLADGEDPESVNGASGGVGRHLSLSPNNTHTSARASTNVGGVDKLMLAPPGQQQLRKSAASALPVKQDLKSVGVTSEMQKIMDRRRQLAETTNFVGDDDESEPEMLIGQDDEDDDDDEPKFLDMTPKNQQQHQSRGMSTPYSSYSTSSGSLRPFSVPTPSSTVAPYSVRSPSSPGVSPVKPTTPGITTAAPAGLSSPVPPIKPSLVQSSPSPNKRLPVMGLSPRPRPPSSPIVRAGTSHANTNVPDDGNKASPWQSPKHRLQLQQPEQKPPALDSTEDTIGSTAASSDDNGASANNTPSPSSSSRNKTRGSPGEPQSNEQDSATALSSRSKNKRVSRKPRPGSLVVKDKDVASLLSYNSRSDDDTKPAGKLSSMLGANSKTGSGDNEDGLEAPVQSEEEVDDRTVSSDLPESLASEPVKAPSSLLRVEMEDEEGEDEMLNFRTEPVPAPAAKTEKKMSRRSNRGSTSGTIPVVQQTGSNETTPTTGSSSSRRNKSSSAAPGSFSSAETETATPPARRGTAPIVSSTPLVEGKPAIRRKSAAAVADDDASTSSRRKVKSSSRRKPGASTAPVVEEGEEDVEKEESPTPVVEVKTTTSRRSRSSNNNAQQEEFASSRKGGSSAAQSSSDEDRSSTTTRRKIRAASAVISPSTGLEQAPGGGDSGSRRGNRSSVSTSEDGVSRRRAKSTVTPASSTADDADAGLRPEAPRSTISKFLAEDDGPLLNIPTVEEEGSRRESRSLVSIDDESVASASKKQGGAAAATTTKRKKPKDTGERRPARKASSKIKSSGGADVDNEPGPVETAEPSKTASLASTIGGRRGNKVGSGDTTSVTSGSSGGDISKASTVPEDPSKFPVWEARDKHPGDKDGKIAVFQRGNKGVAAQWRAESKSWTEIGEVLGKPSSKIKSSAGADVDNEPGPGETAEPSKTTSLASTIGGRRGNKVGSGDTTSVTSGSSGGDPEDPSKFPVWEARDKHPGDKDGKITVFQRGNKGVAAQWHAESKSWTEIGEVLGATGPSTDVTSPAAGTLRRRKSGDSSVASGSPHKKDFEGERRRRSTRSGGDGTTPRQRSKLTSSTTSTDSNESVPRRRSLQSETASDPDDDELEDVDDDNDVDEDEEVAPLPLPQPSRKKSAGVQKKKTSTTTPPPPPPPPPAADESRGAAGFDSAWGSASALSNQSNISGNDAFAGGAGDKDGFSGAFMADFGDAAFDSAVAAAPVTFKSDGFKSDLNFDDAFGASSDFDLATTNNLFAPTTKAERVYDTAPLTGMPTSTIGKIELNQKTVMRCRFKAALTTNPISGNVLLCSETRDGAVLREVDTSNGNRQVMSGRILSPELRAKIASKYSATVRGLADVQQISAGLHQAKGQTRLRVAAMLALRLLHTQQLLHVIAVWKWGNGLPHPVSLSYIMSPPSGGDFAFESSSLRIADNLLFLAGQSPKGPCVLISKPAVREAWTSNSLPGSGKISSMEVFMAVDRPLPYLAVALTDKTVSVWSYKAALEVSGNKGKEQSKRWLFPLSRLNSGQIMNSLDASSLNPDGTATGKGKCLAWRHKALEELAKLGTNNLKRFPSFPNRFEEHWTLYAFGLAQPAQFGIGHAPPRRKLSEWSRCVSCRVAGSE